MITAASAAHHGDSLLGLVTVIVIVSGSAWAAVEIRGYLRRRRR